VSLNRFSVKFQSAAENYDYAERIQLYPSVTINRVRRIGEVSSDNSCVERMERQTGAEKLLFPAIQARVIKNGNISAEYVVHRDGEIYIDSSIYVAHERMYFGENIARRFQDLIDKCDPEIDIRFKDEDVAVFHNEGGGTWGHFVVHNIPRAMLLLKKFPDIKLAVPTALNGYAPNRLTQLMRLAGISPTRLLAIESSRTYAFRKIIICDYLYDGVTKGGRVHPLAIELLESITIDGFDDATGSRPGHWFIERSSGGRNIENLNALRQFFHSRQIESRALGKLPVPEQLSTWQSGSFFCSTLGSDLTNIVFAKPGTKILSLTPDWFGDDFFFDLASAKNLEWNELRCGEIGNPVQPKHRSSFYVDIAALSALLDRAHKKT
jgi:hypothetical protein